MTLKARNCDIKIAKRMLKPYNFKLKINDYGCYFNEQECVINIDRYCLITKEEFWSAFYHEFAHLICFFDFKFMKYHWNRQINVFGKEGWKPYYRKMAFKVERYVDKMGKGMFDDRFSKMKYIPGYDDDESRLFLIDYYGL